MVRILPYFLERSIADFACTGVVIRPSSILGAVTGLKLFQQELCDCRFKACVITQAINAT
jgi:hypothetical protein